MAEPWPEPRHPERQTRTTPAINPSVDFILNSVDLAKSSGYVVELDRFVSLLEARTHEDAILRLWEDSTVEREKLFSAIEELREKSSKNAQITTPKGDLRKFTWKQVISEVQGAGDTYHNDRGRSRKIFQKMCDNAKVFETWLSLLPDGDYGASISGAFVMIVRGARTLNDVQKAIYETLASIPDTLAHANTYVEIYQAHSSDALVQKTAALCKSILQILHLIIQFFLKSSFRRGAAAIFKGYGFEKQLTESIDSLNTQVLQLREEANVCLQRRVAEMDRKNDLRTSKEQYRHQLAKEELLLAIDSSTEITAQKVCTHLLRQLQANPNFSVRTGGLIQPLEAPLQNSDEESPLTQISTRRKQDLTAATLLDSLDYDYSMSCKDIKSCLDRGFAQSDADHIRSNWVFQSPELGTFLAGEKAGSQLLLVNGNTDATDFVSPLSVVCARISDLMGVSGRIILLSYFCGCHTDELREPRANASGILANLLGQLLCQIKNRGGLESKLDLSSDHPHAGDSISEDHLEVLFDMFRKIVEQLPKRLRVFCMLDSLTVYENGERKKDTLKMMRKLLRLLEKSKRTELRVLVTAPGKSIYFDRWTDLSRKDTKIRILNVPEVIA